MRPTAAEIAVQLGLEPHPEGGWYRETYRADWAVETARGTRAACTAILFLVTPASPSRFHRLASDELWVFQGGLPLELVTLDADGGATLRVLGDPAGGPGTLPQALVPAGAWQAARVAGASGSTDEAETVAATRRGSAPPLGGRGRPGDAALAGGGRRWSLVSCVVTPGFEYDDFELAERDELVWLYPGAAALIGALT